MSYVCYLLTCRKSGDAYVGVTGRRLSIRLNGHKHSGRFPFGFDHLLLAQSESEDEIREIEKDFIARLRPRLNRTPGGEALSRSRELKDLFCPKGHWWDEVFRRKASNGKRKCAKCFAAHLETRRRGWIG